MLLTCSGLVEWLGCGLSVPPRACAGVFLKSKFSKLLSRRVVPGTSTHARTSSGFSISVLTISEGFGLRAGFWCQHFRSKEALWKTKQNKIKQHNCLNPKGKFLEVATFVPFGFGSFFIYRNSRRSLLLSIGNIYTMCWPICLSATMSNKHRLYYFWKSMGGNREFELQPYPSLNDIYKGSVSRLMCRGVWPKACYKITLLSWNRTKDAKSVEGKKFS